MNCPVCHKFTYTPKNVVISVYDGGSTYCHACGSTFHKCKVGYKIGSPGPALCKDCKSTNFSFPPGVR